MFPNGIWLPIFFHLLVTDLPAITVLSSTIKASTAAGVPTVTSSANGINLSSNTSLANAYVFMPGNAPTPVPLTVTVAASTPTTTSGGFGVKNGTGRSVIYGHSGQTLVVLFSGIFYGLMFLV